MAIGFSIIGFIFFRALFSFLAVFFLLFCAYGFALLAAFFKFIACCLHAFYGFVGFFAVVRFRDGLYE